MIFVDSSFFTAFVVTNDQWHKNSLKLAKKIVNEEKIVSNLIISESITNVASLLGGKKAKQLYYNIKDNYFIFEENRNIYDRTIYTLLHYDGTLSYADCLSLEIMKELQINKIASFDSDFDKVKGIKRVS
ncbi:type II toxin-antitoxin system VapC family toxin [Methanobrevibacter curvatus]|uniref:PIN domain protein n=1 Tax=Methanobrevibacter curvatus TaxID=49547 RepID=A0A165ZNQ4_9EURY|nr:PIN domain-containing protein [Methanobrevibacter curvatus]KZX10959.1 PIN domain protein [Methanobrevibacter curvatus]